MRINLQLFFLTFFFCTSVLAGTPGEVQTGGYLREATLRSLDGNTRSFADFRGKPLIINVWASYCGPCRDEMGSLERLAQRYNGNQLNIIGISIDDYASRAQAFVKQTSVTFENFLDSKLFLENMLGANRIPLTILVDADGRVLKKARGAYEWDNPDIIDNIAETFSISLTQ